jgi:hypothetical protein
MILSSNLKMPSETQISWFCNSAAPANQAPENIQVKITAILASLARREGNVALNKVFNNFFDSKLIGDWIVTQLKHVCTKEGPSHVELLSELLNGIYDIYGDKNFDYDNPVFVKGGYLNVLVSLGPKIQLKIKSVDKRKARPVRERGDETLVNLRAFISYKKQELK